MVSLQYIQKKEIHGRASIFVVVHLIIRKNKRIFFSPFLSLVHRTVHSLYIQSKQLKERSMVTMI